MEMLGAETVGASRCTGYATGTTIATTEQTRMLAVVPQWRVAPTSSVAATIESASQSSSTATVTWTVRTTLTRKAVPLSQRKLVPTMASDVLTQTYVYPRSGDVMDQMIVTMDLTKSVPVTPVQSTISYVPTNVASSTLGSAMEKTTVVMGQTRQRLRDALGMSLPVPGAQRLVRALLKSAFLWRSCAMEKITVRWELMKEVAVLEIYVQQGMVAVLGLVMRLLLVVSVAVHRDRLYSTKRSVKM